MGAERDRQEGTLPVFLFGNCILDAFSAAIAEIFDPTCLKRVALEPDQVIAQPGIGLDVVYFPQSALISTVVEVGSGGSIDGVLIGDEGAFGAGAVFGVEAQVFSSVVQRPGSCWLMPVPELRRLVRERPEAAAILFRHQHFLLAQAQQMAACAVKHHVRQRFCTHLLRVQDEDGEIRLIQEHLARTLGVQRTSISLVAGGLQGDGLIRYQRGRIRIVDLEGLRAGACECHGIIQSFKRALLEAAPTAPAVTSRSA